MSAPPSTPRPRPWKARRKTVRSLYADLPLGASVLEATTTFVIMAALGDRLAPYAGNERVEKITLTASTAGAAATRLTTVSGKVYMAPPGLWAAGG